MDWKIAYAHQEECVSREYNTIEALEGSGFDIIPAAVPGNFELDLMRAGRLPDLYYSENTLEAQKLEDVHVWYYTVLEIGGQDQYLRFEGIDTFADIYVNGKLVKSTDNMFLAYDVKADWLPGGNEIVVHIKPTMLEARKFTPPVACNTMKYGAASLYVRKAAHMFGWDIMPRIVSAGLWKDVTVQEEKADKINEVYLITNKIDKNEADGSCRAFMRFYINADLSGSFATEYTVRVEGICTGSRAADESANNEGSKLNIGSENRDGCYLKNISCFKIEEKLWHNTHAFNFEVNDCLLWWPKNAGEANLYDITVTLLHKGKVCDTYRFKAGIRTVELRMTDITDARGSGEFCFFVNNKKIFVMGTNWVPLDAFHSNDKNRLPAALEMLDDIGCNMVRCWGGNVYESEEFFEYCDAHGIMIWQDFGMGCAVYPDEAEFARRLEEEAIFQIKRLRNHASLVLWAGDNECDLAHEWSGYRRNPNQNGLTRNVLKRAVEMHDYSRPYLPSSPYVSEEVYSGKGIMPENHLWGPRDYFKGDFYRNTFCHFASETGYHGFPSPQSLKRFLKEPEKIFEVDGTAADEYLVHAASMETGGEGPFAYRIRLAYDQVITLFGGAEEKFDDFLRQSQISQAEAKKYFIEKFRIGKWNRTGIIWWNLLDGWPQVSDAIVDYYFTRKLAYHYIKRSQEPVCLMFDEPENGGIRLVGVNDLPEDVQVSYMVKRVGSAAQEDKQEDKIVLSGETTISADSAVKIDALPIADGEKKFYLIEWKVNGQECKNHYFTNIIDIDYGKYMSALKKCGMDEFEGF